MGSCCALEDSRMGTRTLGVLAGIATMALAGTDEPASAKAARDGITVSANARKATIRRYIGIWQSGRVDQLGGVIAHGYVGHAASGDRDIVGLRTRIAAFRAAYPDMRFTIEDQLADGDRVATRMTAVGRSAKTGQRVRLVGINISRFAGNRVVEEWPAWEPAAGAAP